MLQRYFDFFHMSCAFFYANIGYQNTLTPPTHILMVLQKIIVHLAHINFTNIPMPMGARNSHLTSFIWLFSCITSYFWSILRFFFLSLSDVLLMFKNYRMVHLIFATYIIILLSTYPFISARTKLLTKMGVLEKVKWKLLNCT